MAVYIHEPRLVYLREKYIIPSRRPVHRAARSPERLPCLYTTYVCTMSDTGTACSDRWCTRGVYREVYTRQGTRRTDVAKAAKVTKV